MGLRYIIIPILIILYLIWGYKVISWYRREEEINEIMILSIFACIIFNGILLVFIFFEYLLPIITKYW